MAGGRRGGAAAEPTLERTDIGGVGAAVEVDLCAVCRKVVTDEVFSICCDKCDRWVHGHCIEMDAAVGEQVKKYYCPECQDEHDLEVVYKKV